MPLFLKASMFGVTTVAILLGGVALFQGFVSNPSVVAELNRDPLGERAGIVMLLTLPGGRTIPVNYLREGECVYAGADGPWWRAFRNGGAPVTLWIRGETLAGRGEVVIDDPGYTNAVFRRLRPNVPDWLPDWADAKLVVVTLDAADAGCR